MASRDLSDMFRDPSFVKDWDFTKRIGCKPNVVWGKTNSDNRPVAVLTCKKAADDFSVSRDGLYNLAALERDASNPLAQAYVVLFEQDESRTPREVFVAQETVQGLLRRIPKSAWRQGTHGNGEYCWVDRDLNVVINDSNKQRSPLAGV